MKNLSSILLLALIGTGFAGCAHQSTVVPSNGHIDGQSNPSQPSPTAAADIPKPIKTPAYLPPPKAKAKEQTYSVVVNDVPVKEILFALARESKLNVDINPGVQGRVTLNAVDQTLPAILERLSKQVDLTYKIENNVLYIGPDLPVLRTYKVDYVNMSRDTTGFIGVAAEISGTGRSASTGTSGSSTTGTSGGSSSSGAASNSSRTQVASVSQNHFWASLIQNIKDILAETDKEVIISRGDGSDQAEASTTTAQTPSADGSNPSDKTNITVTLKPTAQDREAARTEYKTLFAATVIANQEAGIISVRGTSKQHEKVQEFLD
ncbi:MAG TPA: secretin N-terminal domain-containing protein, partial [Methyloradius sp.]